MQLGRRKSGHQKDRGRFCYNDIVHFVGVVVVGVGIVFIGEGLCIVHWKGSCLVVVKRNCGVGGL